MSRIRLCGLVPTYNNPVTLPLVVEALLGELPHVIIVDDASDEPGRRVAMSLENERTTLVVRGSNGGKGAAVKDGLREAERQGFTHAFQVDADAQHDLGALRRFVQEAEAKPNAAILAFPLFDASAPRARLIARKLTLFWTNIETGGRRIFDPMCGFRIYPVKETNKLRVEGDFMDYDPEVAVRLVWAGVEICNLPVGVRYRSQEEGGVSHFRLLRDNLRISWMHTRLVSAMLFQFVFGWLGRSADG